MKSFGDSFVAVAGARNFAAVGRNFTAVGAGAAHTKGPFT